MRIVLLIVGLYFINSQYLVSQKKFDGWITTNEGTQVYGQITMFHCMDGRIHLKNENDKKEVFKTPDIKEITLVSDGDTTIYNKYAYSMAMWSSKQKMQKGTIWAHKSHSTPKATIYFAPDFEVIQSPASTKSWQKFQMYVLFEGKDHLYYLTEYDQIISDPFHAYDKRLRKLFEIAIKEECPQFVAMLKEKKYQTEDYEKMLDDYNSVCN